MKALKRILLVLFIVAMLGAIAIALLVRRGFRATATPSAWETAVALTLRNLAISKHERNGKNPFAASSETMQQGREYFLTRCAACHGIDGSGKTQMGLNLYPRVPDLRAAATQNLTDAKSTTSSKTEWHSQGCLPGAIRTGNRMPIVGSSSSSSEVCGRCRTKN
ncbi:MAG TPA: c-type cytochrome [Acidobacteriaceae bacterium]|nr:c-type cytochrome [Acidobacteriaceae bacterium]